MSRIGNCQKEPNRKRKLDEMNNIDKNSPHKMCATCPLSMYLEKLFLSNAHEMTFFPKENVIRFMEKKTEDHQLFTENPQLYDNFNMEDETLFIRLSLEGFVSLAKHSTGRVSFSLLNIQDQVDNPYYEFLLSIWRGKEIGTQLFNIMAIQGAIFSFWTPNSFPAHLYFTKLQIWL